MWQSTYWNPLGGFLPSGIVGMWFSHSPFLSVWHFTRESILLINSISLFDRFRQHNFKFMGSFKILSAVQFHHENYSVSILQDMMNTPVKCWFMLNALCYGIFSDNFSHDVELSFHLQQMFQPAVVLLRVSHPLTIIIWSSMLRAEASFLWSMTVSNKRYTYSSTSHWEYIDSAMILAANVVTGHKQKHLVSLVPDVIYDGDT